MAGNDQLFHKRKARRENDHKREMAKRAPYDMVLIVCEGAKTEPNYFKVLIKHLKLNTANVIIDDTAGSSPGSVVKRALEEFQKTKDYNKVFCVFDRDTHGDYKAAVDTIRRAQLGKGHSIRAITSVPCFEFWLLLHFKRTEKDYYDRLGSICDKVIIDLEEFIPDYAKGNTQIFLSLKDKLETAIKHAKQVCASRETAGIDEDLGTYNPYTNVHELVSYLQELSPQKANSG
ncbi:MAG: RloB domain-containing protein [Deltaproteobacteria bacterium]|nr:RloB domain-containing protein [Deltaproteobacteria bacterium]